MRFKQDLPTYNPSNYSRTESLEREKRRGPNKKKIREFIIQAANSVRIAIDAGNSDASLHNFLHHRVVTAAFWRTFHAHPLSL
jgi:hypothetical protein